MTEIAVIQKLIWQKKNDFLKSNYKNLNKANFCIRGYLGISLESLGNLGLMEINCE